MTIARLSGGRSRRNRRRAKKIANSRIFANRYGLSAFYSMSETTGTTIIETVNGSAWDGTYANVTLGNTAGVRHLKQLAYPDYNGSTSKGEPPAAFASGFDGALGSMFFMTHLDAAEWASATSRWFFWLATADSSASLGIMKSAADTVLLRWRMSSTDYDVTHTLSPAPGAEWLTMGATWSDSDNDGELRLYVRGIEPESETSLPVAWSGTITQMYLGIDGASPTKGRLGNFGFKFGGTLSAAEFAAIDRELVGGRSYVPGWRVNELGAVEGWMLDESTGTAAAASRNSAYDATYAGTYTLADRPGPGALSGYSFVDLAGTGDVDVYSAAVVAAWDSHRGAMAGIAKIESGGWTDGSNYDIFRFSDAANNNFVGLFKLGNNNIRAAYRADFGTYAQTVTMDIPMTTEDWFHWCVLWDQPGDRLELWLDGALAGRRSGLREWESGAVLDTNKAVIGRRDRGIGAFYWKGHIGAVHLWASQLPDPRSVYAQMVGSYGSSVRPKLTAWYRLGESSGQRDDSHTNVLHLSDNNTVGQAVGKVGNAALFTEANSEWLSHADDADLSPGTDSGIALFGWFYLNTVGGDNQCLIGKANAFSIAGVSYILQYEGAIDRFRFYVSNGTSFTSVRANNLGAVSSGTWYFIVAQHDPDTDELRISVNDGDVDSTAWEDGTYDDSHGFALGRLGESASNYSDARMDEVGIIIGDTLTEAEITWLYNAGNGRSYVDV